MGRVKSKQKPTRIPVADSDVIYKEEAQCQIEVIRVHSGCPSLFFMCFPVIMFIPQEMPYVCKKCLRYKKIEDISYAAPKVPVNKKNNANTRNVKNVKNTKLRQNDKSTKNIKNTKNKKDYNKKKNK